MRESEKMPSFIDIFIPRLQKNAKEIREALGGEFSPSSQIEILRKLVNRHWNSLPLLKVETTNIAGCDGSSSSLNLRNGGLFGIVRAMTKGTKTETRNLDVGVVQGTHNTQFISHLMQFLEVLSMRKFVETQSPEVLIMDGSPITFLYQNLVDLQVYLPQDLAPLNFTVLDDVPPSAISILKLKEFMRLFEIIAKEGIQLIGISKDSRVSQFQQVILLQQITIEIDQLPINTAHKNELKSTVSGEHIVSYNVFSSFEKVAKTYNLDPYEDWTGLMSLVYLLLFPLSDLEVVKYCTDTAGFTQPLMIKANDRLNRMENLFLANPRTFIRSNYPLSLSVVPPQKRAGFIQKVSHLLAEMKNFPSIISCVVKATPQGYPMRVDIIGEKGTFWGSPRFQFMSTPHTLEHAIGVVQQYFVDDKIHNAVVWEVDKEVRISRKQTMNVYLASLEQEIGLSRSEFLARREIRYL